MKQANTIQKADKNFINRRRRKTFIWVIASTVAVSLMLYYEQAALLFVVSTLALSILLFIVAFADLEGKDFVPQQTDDLPDMRDTEKEQT